MYGAVNARQLKMKDFEFSDFWGLLGDEPTIIDKDTREATYLKKLIKRVDK